MKKKRLNLTKSQHFKERNKTFLDNIYNTIYSIHNMRKDVKRKKSRLRLQQKDNKFDVEKKVFILDIKFSNV